MADTIDAFPSSTAQARLVTDPNDLFTSLGELVSVEIAGVTINENPVDALGIGGRFFETVSLAAGDNVLTVRAETSNGATKTASITLV